MVMWSFRLRRIGGRCRKRNKTMNTDSTSNNAQPSSSATVPGSSNAKDLRRSKRKTPRLDYAAAASSGDLKKLKMVALSVDIESTSSASGASSGSSAAGATLATIKEEVPSPTELVEVKEEGKRTRRSTAPLRHFGYIYPDDGDDDERGFVGNFACSKCPARYETKGGLNNHVKLHSTDKRKFQCDLCDFSSSTSKAMMQHSRLHKQFGVVSAQPSPSIPAEQYELENKKLKEEIEKEAQRAPMLVAVNLEQFEMNEEKAEPSFTPPPVLIAETFNSNGLKSESPNPIISRSISPKESKPGTASPAPAKTPAMKQSANSCPHCPFVGQSVTRLKRHLKGHFLDRGYACPSQNCSYKCTTAGFLKRHYILHKEQLPWPPVYVEGNKIVEDKYVKRNRLRPLAQIKSKVRVGENGESKCNVEGCEFVATSSLELISHKVRAHKAMESFAQKHLCFKCGSRFSTFKKLQAHKLSRHTVIRRRYARSFYLREIIGEHYIMKHLRSIVDDRTTADDSKKDDLDESFDASFGGNDVQGEEVYHCDLCPYKAVTANRVERHRAKHMVENEFKCNECSFSCRTDNALNQHKRLHSEKPEAGAETGEQPGSSSSPSASTASASLDQPPELEMEGVQEQKTEEKKVDYRHNLLALRDAIRPWTKKYDERTKSITDNFTRTVIDGQKGFQCIDCPYISKYRGDIRTHKMRHFEIQQYRCTQCSYSAQRPVSLRDHLRQHVIMNEGVSERNQFVKIKASPSLHIGNRCGRGRDRMYCCHACPFVTPAIGNLYRHNRLHKKVPQIHICSTCTYSSVDKTKMDEHILIHGANGMMNPFVRRVNKEGATVSMITDFSFEAQSIVSAGSAAAALNVSAPPVASASGVPVQKLTSKNPSQPTGKSLNPVVKQLRKTAKASGRSSRKQSPSPPQRQSERSTRSKNNYFMMVNTGSKAASGGKPTPSPPLPLPATTQTVAPPKPKLTAAEEKKETAKTELTHVLFRDYLRKEKQAEESRSCPDCPYVEQDLQIFKMHRDLHFNDGKPRQFACCSCSYSCYTPAALRLHLKVHAPVGELGESSTYTKKRQTLRKTEVIPAGAKSFDCSTCSYRTVDYQNFCDHRSEHVRLLHSKMSTLAKRNPREDYSKPKKRFDTKNRNVIYCNKCNFQCNTMQASVSHGDRHGWKQLFKCRMCDYSDNTKNVVDFHEANHHVVRHVSLVDMQASLTFKSTNGFVTNPGLDGVRKPTPEEFMRASGSSIKCTLCNYVTNVAEELGFHYSTKHVGEPGAKEAASYLSMGFCPPESSTPNPVSSSC